MFRSPRYLEKVDYERFDLNTPFNSPANGQHQVKTGMKFEVKDRDIVYDWYNAYFRVEYQFQVLADHANVAANVQSAPVNGSFSLIKGMTVSSAGKKLYEASRYSFFEELSDRLLPPIRFDLRASKESVTGDEKKLVLHYRLNEAANAQAYTIYVAYLNEEEIVIKEIGNELVVA